MTIQTDSFTEIIEALDFVPEIPCEARSHRASPHPADSYAVWSCGCVIANCNERVQFHLDSLRRGEPYGCSRHEVNPIRPLRIIPIGGSK